MREGNDRSNFDDPMGWIASPEAASNECAFNPWGLNLSKMVYLYKRLFCASIVLLFCCASLAQISFVILALLLDFFIKTLAFALALYCAV